jgi:hypothetical protein
MLIWQIFYMVTNNMVLFIRGYYYYWLNKVILITNFPSLSLRQEKLEDDNDFEKACNINEQVEEAETGSLI